MSNFAQKKGWADSDSESDGEEEFQVVQKGFKATTLNDKVIVPVKQVEQVLVDSESEEEEDLKIDASKFETSTLKKEKPTVALTKKEKSELKKKELDELDSILAEFKTTTETVESPVPAAQPVEESLENNTTNEDNKKKDKKKKKKSTSSSSKKEETAEVVDETPVPTGPIDVAAILKAKTAKSAGKSTKQPAMTDAQKIALNEMNANNNNKKKKKDTTKFCEGSY